MATQRKITSQGTQHILLLGATGISGLAFIKYHLSIPDTEPSKPYLTLYTRSSGREKLTSVLPTATSTDTPAHKIRIITGSLADKSTITKALLPSSDNAFPKVTAVISVLGAYMSLYYFLTRFKPTPIADAFRTAIIPAMLEQNVARILALSTFSAFPVPGERENRSWSWFFNSLIPFVVVPQGHAEMKGIGEAVLDNSSGKELRAVKGLQSTVFRVPFLTEGDERPEREVRAFVIGGKGNTENKVLSRESMVRWLLDEVESNRWVTGAPMLCNLD